MGRAGMRDIRVVMLRQRGSQRVSTDILGMRTYNKGDSKRCSSSSRDTEDFDDEKG